MYIRLYILKLKCSCEPKLHVLDNKMLAYSQDLSTAVAPASVNLLCPKHNFNSENLSLNSYFQTIQTSCVALMCRP